jgi:ribosome recycling factor
VRDARREALSLLKEMDNSGDIPADDRRRAEKKIQDLTDEFVGRIDSMTSEKEVQVLEV